MARRQNKGGRPRTKLSEEAPRRALEGGATYETIAEANGCSKRTIVRRVAAARREHGQLWGKPLEPKTPAKSPDPEPPKLLDLDPDEGDGDTAVAEAIALLRQAVRGVPVTPIQIAAAKATVGAAELIKSEGQSDDEVDHSDLLERMQQATESAAAN